MQVLLKPSPGELRNSVIRELNKLLLVTRTSVKMVTTRKRKAKAAASAKTTEKKKVKSPKKTESTTDPLVSPPTSSVVSMALNIIQEKVSRPSGEKNGGRDGEASSSGRPCTRGQAASRKKEVKVQLVNPTMGGATRKTRSTSSKQRASVSPAAALATTSTSASGGGGKKRTYASFGMKLNLQNDDFRLQMKDKLWSNVQMRTRRDPLYFKEELVTEVDPSGSETITAKFTASAFINQGVEMVFEPTAAVHIIQKTGERMVFELSILDDKKAKELAITIEVLYHACKASFGVVLIPNQNCYPTEEKQKTNRVDPEILQMINTAKAKAQDEVARVTAENGEYILAGEIEWQEDSGPPLLDRMDVEVAMLNPEEEMEMAPAPDLELNIM